MKLIKQLSASALLIVLCSSFSAWANGDDTNTALGSLMDVLVTGASSGIGLRMTEVLSQNGFIVYAGARSDDDLARLEAMDNVESIRLDVTIESDIVAAVDTVTEKGRGLYGLINNAGVAIFGPMSEVPLEQLEFQMDVNVLGP